MAGYNYASDCSMNGSKFLLTYRKVASTSLSCLEWLSQFWCLFTLTFFHFYHFITFIVSKVLIVTGKDTFDHIKVSEVIDLSIEGDHQCFDWFDYPLNISEATGGLVISNDINIYTNRYNLTDIDIMKNSYYNCCFEICKEV